MLTAEDMSVTLAFYTKVLLFEVVMQTPNYAILSSDGATVHFMKAANEEVMKAVRGHTEIYIEVSDIDSIWAHVRQFKTDYSVRDLFEQEYGMREFHISDPNGCLVFVGQKI